MERKRDIPMNITPVIPDGYNGPIKQLTCRICRHIFYLTQADYARLAEVSYCHECSLILAEELEKNQVARSSISSKQTPVPASHPPEPALRYKEALASYEQALRCDPVCLAALYGKGEMLRQLSRPQGALTVYDEILRLDPTAVKAAAMRGWALISLRRYEEALAAFDQALQLAPSASEPESGKDFILTHI